MTSAGSPRAWTGNLVRLRAGGDTCFLRLDAGGVEVAGIAGPRPPSVTFAQYLDQDGGPDALEFLRAHDVVDVEYTSEQAAWGVDAPDRRLVARGCTLEAVTFVELQGGEALRFSLKAQRLTGDLVPGLEPE